MRRRFVTPILVALSLAMAALALPPLANAQVLKTELETIVRFGGPGSDRVTAMVSDPQGNLYITGSTKSSGLATPGAFQTTPAGFGFTGGDAYVAKLDGDTLEPIWVTYLGGSHSENGIEDSGGLAIGPGGTVIVAGTTSSVDFPTTPDAIQPDDIGVGEELFISILSADGSELLYSSYLGGSGGDLLMAFVRGSDGKLYLGGQTSSLDFPVTADAVQSVPPGGSHSGFFTRLSPDAKSIEYSSYIGGEGSDRVKAIAVRSVEEIWIGGETGSADFPITPDAFDRTFGGCGTIKCDLFLLRLNATTNEVVYASFFGGNNSEGFGDAVLFGKDTLYITGDTSSPDFPLTNWTVQPIDENPATGDGFILKFDTTSHKIAYSTLLGGERAGETMYGIATSLGGAFIVGNTFSRDFPVTGNAAQDALAPGGFYNGAMAKVSSDGRVLIYGSYLGGDGFDSVKLITERKTLFPTFLRATVLFVAGETRSTSIHPLDPGSLGLTDVFISRWIDEVVPVIFPE